MITPKDTKDTYRNFDDANYTVKQFYKKNHQFQTLAYVKEQIEKYCTNFNKQKMSIWDAIEKLDSIVDESDPDLDKTQIIHAFQTAEGLRRHYPDIEWLPLVGLIHDLGKVISLSEFGSQPQWSTVGDIYPVGCQFSTKIVFHEFFENNPDSNNSEYDSLYGIYEPKCGLDNLYMSFGHDYYMYSVLKHNKCLIPKLGLDMIRYHSFYSWHKEGAYEYFMNDSDYELRRWVKRLSDCDLYTKDNNFEPNIDELKNYYQGLIDKYFPNSVLEW